MPQHLRLFTGEDALDVGTNVAEPEVTVTVGDVARILADAVRTRRAWLKDFEDDRMQISADLYEVLSTYWNLRPCA